MTNSEERFNNKHFRDVLARYETSKDTPENMFFDVDDIMDIAEYYNFMGDMEKARTAADTAAKLYPHSSMVLTLQARLAMFCDNDIAKAKHYACLIEKEGCEDLEYYYLKAEIMIAEDDIDGAEKYLESKLTMLDGDDLADYLLEVPTIFLDYRLPELAQKWLVRSSEKDEFDYRETEARIAFQTEDYAKSETLFKKLLEEEPFSTSLWNTLASSQYMNGHLAESLESSEYAIAINPNDAEALLNKARTLAAMYKFEDAAHFYERYLKLYPHDVPVRSMYAVTLVATGDFDNALTNLYMAKSQCTDPTMMPDLIKQIAYLLPKKGRTEDALALVKNAEADGTIDHTSQLLAKGRIYVETDDYARANDCFLEAFISSNHDMQTYLEVSMAYYEKDHINEALQTLLAGLSFNPLTKRGFAYLADCYRQTGRTKEFLETLKLACKYNPLEAKEVLGEFFPDDMDPADFYDYAVKKTHGKKP